MVFNPRQEGRNVRHGTGKYQRDIASVSQSRVILVAGLFTLAFSIICLRLVDVMVIGHEPNSYYTSGYDDEIQVQRAEIHDRNGELLAINLTTASLYVNPQIIMDVDEAVKKVHKVLPDLDKAQLKKDFSSDKSFIWIKRNLTPKEQYAVNRLGIPALSFETEERRIYPQGEVFSHVLGYVGIDGKGLAGVEKGLDKRLLDDNKPLRLSLDARVQNILYEELRNSQDKFSAKAAAGVVMDVNNGEVVALVSLPAFDPHNPSKSSNDAIFNRTTLGVYELGSVFKTFTVAMALDQKKAGLGSVYEVGEPIKVGRFRIRDTHPKGNWMNVPQIFMYSSNIGTAKVAMDVGRVVQRDYMEKLGLLSDLSIEIPEKTLPLYPSGWSEVNMMTISYGHGIAVSPVHMAQATAALVNGGLFRPATLLLTKDAVEGVRVVKQETSQVIRKLLRLVVEHGTGKKSNVKGYFVGGKTGTAEKSVKGGYDRKAMVSSFVGVFPMNRPQYVVYALLDEPKGIRETGGWATGGMTVAPLVGNVIERIGPVLGVKPVNSQDDELRREFYVDYEMGGSDLAAFKDFSVRNRL